MAQSRGCQGHGAKLALLGWTWTGCWNREGPLLSLPWLLRCGRYPPPNKNGVLWARRPLLACTPFPWLLLSQGLPLAP